MLEIFSYDFMLRAFAAGIVTAIVAPSIGIFLVMRRYSFMADTLAHVSLAGVGLAALLGLQPIATAMLLAIGAAAAAERMRRNGKVLGESALALLLSGGLALSAVLLSLSKGSANLSAILFGSITTVTATDLWIIIPLGIAVLAVILVLFRHLFAASFDEELALASGIPARAVNAVLLLAAAITVSVSMRIVGVLLVGALMVIPVIAAQQLRQGFRRTWIISVGISLFSTVAGLLVSYYAGLASGGTIVLMTIACFAVGAITRRS
jgi:zinc transport system permease protein